MSEWIIIKRDGTVWDKAAQKSVLVPCLAARPEHLVCLTSERENLFWLTIHNGGKAWRRDVWWVVLKQREMANILLCILSETPPTEWYHPPVGTSSHLG